MLVLSQFEKHGNGSLVQICTFPVQGKIKNAAKELGDHGLLTKVLGDDLIALKVKYHKNCLTEITTKAKRREIRPSNEESETSVFDKVFDKLIPEIEADFFQGAAFSTSFPLSQYKIHLKESNYSEYEGYRFERLKKPLQNQLQDKIVIHQTKAANEPDLIYCSQVNLQTAINKLALLKREARLEAIENDLELPEEESQNSNLFYTALALRSAVREVVGLDITSRITSEDICAEI